MKVKYKGVKEAGMPTMLPIGCQSMTAKSGTILITKEGTEMSDQDAVKLCLLDPQNFELMVDKPKEDEEKHAKKPKKEKHAE